jgi:hypothetical protein
MFIMSVIIMSGITISIRSKFNEAFSFGTCPAQKHNNGERYELQQDLKGHGELGNCAEYPQFRGKGGNTGPVQVRDD